MQNTEYREQLNKRLLDLGENISNGSSRGVPDVEKTYEILRDVKEEAGDTGVFLPFREANKLLGLSEYEELMVCVLWYRQVNVQESISVERLLGIAEPYQKKNSFSPLPICFHGDREAVVLSPVYLSFLQDRIPNLPEGMELLFPAKEKIYGNLYQAESIGKIMNQKEITNAKIALVISGAPGSGRHFLMEQVCAREQLPALLVHTKNHDFSMRQLNEMLLCVMLQAALPIIDMGGDLQTELLQKLSSQYSLLVIIKDSSLYLAEDIGYGIIEKKLEKPDKITKLQIIEDALQQYQCEEMLPKEISREQMAGKQMETGEFIRYIRNICLELLTGNTKIQKQIYQTGSLHLDLLPVTRTFAELKLPKQQFSQLHRICDMIAAKEDVMQKWGFGRKFSYGNGMAILFYGAPGTGKTMAAQVMANELGMPLYRVDLSQLISKYIGETQKNIGRIFDEADKCDCILLFDEADAIFAKRSDVSDAQDRYSNAETAYLLQRIEQYSGVSILATNLLQNFDEAFRRRISYMVHFPMPDMTLRQAMWEDIYPAEAKISSDMDYPTLAQAFELSGAAIKNAALHAAYLAMADGTDIGMKQVLESIANEYNKTGKSINKEQQELMNAYLQAGQQKTNN